MTMTKVPVFNFDFKPLGEVYLAPKEINYLRTTRVVSIAILNEPYPMVYSSSPEGVMTDTVSMRMVRLVCERDCRSPGNPLRVVFWGDQEDFDLLAALREADYWEGFLR